MLTLRLFSLSVAIVAMCAAAVIVTDAHAATGDMCAAPPSVKRSPKRVTERPTAAQPYVVEVWGDSVALMEAPHLSHHLPGSTLRVRAAHGALLSQYAGHQDGTQVLVIATGVNEPDAGMDADTFRQALADAVVQAQTQGVRVILVTPQRPRADYATDVTLHLAAVRDVARITGATLVDRYALVGTLTRDERLSTQVLPTARAADLGARAVAKAVQS